MRIAIIAWGSLVWDPRSLQIKGEWDNNGPNLNIEFSHVSKDGRLTLVIDHDNGAKVKTYCALSKRCDLGDAVADVRDREGTIIKKIGFIKVKNGHCSKEEFPDQIDVFQIIRDWCKSSSYDAVVWTALTSQFKDQTKMDFSVDNAINYLKGLPKSARSNALDYIRNAPKEVITPVRERIEQLNYKL